MADVLSELLVKIGALKDVSYDKVLSEVESSFKSKMANIESIAKVTALSFGGLGAAATGLMMNFTHAAENAERFKYQLSQMGLSAGDASKKFEELQNMAAKSLKFDTSDFVLAYNRMENMKKGSSDLIPAIAKMAGLLGHDLGESAMMVSRALSGEARGLMMLSRQYGITKDKLKEFNSEFDISGVNMKRNGEIIKEYMIAKYGDAAKGTDTLAGSHKQLHVEIEKFKESIGVYYLPMMKDVIGGLGKWTKALNELDDGHKWMYAEMLKWIAIVGTATGAIGGLTLAYYKLRTAILAFPSIGQGSLLAPVLPWIAILGYATKVAIDSKSATEQTLRYEEQITEELKKQDAIDRNRQIRVKGALKKFGEGKDLTSTETADAINENVHRQEFYNNALDVTKKRISDLLSIEKTGGIMTLQQKTELDGLYKATDFQQKKLDSLKIENNLLKASIEKHPEKEAPAHKRGLVEIQKQISLLKDQQDLDGLNIKQKEKLAGLLREEAAILKENKDITGNAHKLSVEAHKLEKEIKSEETKNAKEAESAHKRAHIEHLQLAKEEYARKKELRDTSLQEDLTFEQQLLKNAHLTISEKITEEHKIAMLKKEIHTKEIEDAKKLKDEKQRKAQESYKTDLESIEEVKSLRHVSYAEEMKLLSDFAIKYKGNAKIQEEVNKHTIDEQKKHMAERYKMEKSIKEEVFKLTHTAQEYEIYQLNEKIAKMRDLGMKEVDIKKYIEAEKARLSKEGADKEVNTQSDLIQRLESLRKGRGNSPLMSLEEVALQSSIAMGTGMSGESSQGRNPAHSFDTSLLSKLGQSNTTNQSSTKNYNISIDGITLAANNAIAKTLTNILSPLVTANSINRSMSYE